MQLKCSGENLIARNTVRLQFYKFDFALIAMKNRPATEGQ